MSTDQGQPAPDQPGEQPSKLYKPLRIWPVVLLLAGIGVCRYLPKFIEDAPPEIWMVAGFGPLICCALIFLWWVAASRATTQERLIGGVALVAIAVATLTAIDETMRGPGVMLLTAPMGMIGFAVAAILCSRWLSFRRTVLILLVSACCFGYSILLRNDGMSGDFKLGLHWRWLASAEDKLLAEKDEAAAEGLVALDSPEIEQALASPEWPAFRGADRSGIQRGTIIDSDWQQRPPEQLWKIAIGPGWASFAVAGNLLFTQEQRGTLESVVCYDADTGKQLWIHEDESRFFDPLGGAGPRATPTLSEGGLFAMGANGHLTRLDPKTGQVVWQQDIRKAEFADRDPPEWGFSSSPLVTDGLAIVHAGGEGDKGILAFDAETGELKWSAASGDHSYSSPQLGTIAGEDYVLMVTNDGLNVLDPASGQARLDYSWEFEQYRCLQPKVLGNDVLIPTGMGAGTRRVRITSSDGQLTTEDLWTSLSMKGDYNDFVVYQDHAFGFDGSIFACVELEEGKRMWKRGRYGNGQVLLLEDSELLLVIGEKGELVLLKPDPSKHSELVKISALEGKTWNHPVVVGDRLYIRNSQEAACYRLPLKENEPPTTPLAQRTR